MSDLRLESLAADQAVRELHAEAAVQRLVAEHRSLHAFGLKPRLAAVLRGAADRLSPDTERREATRGPLTVGAPRLHGVR
jgi:hypothetical protein